MPGTRYDKNELDDEIVAKRMKQQIESFVIDYKEKGEPYAVELTSSQV